MDKKELLELKATEVFITFALLVVMRTILSSHWIFVVITFFTSFLFGYKLAGLFMKYLEVKNEKNS
jgi:hypothetical protein